MVTKKIAALITCHNRKEKTINCLNSFHDAIDFVRDEIKFDIFLVDDGSTDGTSDEVHAKYPTINIINGNGNLYWNRGMNLAWETAAKNNYDFYLWLNDDVILHHSGIENIIADSHAKNDRAIIAGACQSKNGDVTYSGYNSNKKKKIKPNGYIQHCDYFNGNLVLIPSLVFEKLGFLDPIYHHAQGDFDYGYRAKKVGINSYVSSDFVGICELHDELPKWCNPSYDFNIRLKDFKSPLGGNPYLTFIFQRKHIGLIPAIFHFCTIYLRLIFPFLWKNE